jgi:hypothetical protein
LYLNFFFQSQGRVLFHSEKGSKLVPQWDNITAADVLTTSEVSPVIHFSCTLSAVCYLLSAVCCLLSISCTQTHTCIHMNAGLRAISERWLHRHIHSGPTARGGGAWPGIIRPPGAPYPPGPAEHHPVLARRLQRSQWCPACHHGSGGRLPPSLPPGSVGHQPGGH